MTDPVLEALWKKVLDEWDDDGTHGRFLEHCRTTQQLLEAAVRYRGMAGDHARGPSARKRLQAIAVLAVTELETQRSPASRTRGAALRVFIVAFFLVASLALSWALLR